MARATPTTRATIYARVSTTTKGQDNEVQLRELREFVARRGWTLAGEYTDTISGAKDKRPGLDKLMADARRRRVDVIVVWALDRLGRSLRHLVNLAVELEALGVDLACVTQAIDTTTPTGRLTFAVLGAVAQFEREMTRARVVSGIATARAKGIKLGRPAKDIDLGRARQLLDGGASVRAVARTLAVHPNTLRRALADAS